MAATLTSRPTSTLSRDRIRHEEARRTSIMVATVISEILKTMLGPKGMSKMLVTATGDVVITSEGKTTLEKLNVTHPIARILIDAAKTQYTIAGDGTKTVVILAAELLKEAGKLLDQNIHPTVIIKGYEEATRKTLEILELLSKPVSIEDDEALKNVARMVIGSRIAMDLQNRLADIVVIAAKRVAEENLGKIIVNLDNVDFTKKGGGSLNDSELMNGLIIYKGRPHPRMPWRVENAKIALLKCSLEPFTRKNMDWRKEYLIKTPEQLKEFIEGEKEFNRGVVENVKRVGAQVLFCRKRISESILNCFAEEGIMALDMTGEKDMARLEKATGGKIVSSINELTERDLGEAGLVEFRKISGNEMLFIDRCKNPKATSILIRGGTEHVVEELERIIKASLKAVAVTIECGKIIAGGGAIEMEIAGRLRDFSRTFKGREQLAIEAFASAVEAIPKTLATNAGLDPINVLVELRSRHTNGFTNLGVNAAKREIEDVVEERLVESYKVKQHAFKAASETATTILRVDDFINATRQKERGEEEKRLAMERKRIMDEKIRKLLEKEEELKQVDKSVMEKMMHPETI
ncbi:MAG: thermosome subunit [Candidatus Freyarchaeota archaeon]|nr:thermosome subunit [Candidatus Jordarchaeia archaeon]MBS7267632.1 thermosome subunit [Candidatus Jordarchaeia archaeon]MBS7278970.1 thermosome subunit [Candidatus Jordarchaeia archaeon]